MADLLLLHWARLGMAVALFALLVTPRLIKAAEGVGRPARGPRTSLSAAE